jgi:glycosyltransferase involved in cell wall biosynthesis
VYVGEADFSAKVSLYGGARALLYPFQSSEPFGLVLAEAMACGTPVAALDRGAVREVVDDGETGSFSRIWNR